MLYCTTTKTGTSGNTTSTGVTENTTMYHWCQPVAITVAPPLAPASGNSRAPLALYTCTLLSLRLCTTARPGHWTAPYSCRTQQFLEACEYVFVHAEITRYVWQWHHQWNSFSLLVSAPQGLGQGRDLSSVLGQDLNWNMNKYRPLLDLEVPVRASC